jgi:hypothetical protein
MYTKLNAERHAIFAAGIPGMYSGNHFLVIGSINRKLNRHMGITVNRFQPSNIQK